MINRAVLLLAVISFSNYLLAESYTPRAYKANLLETNEDIACFRGQKVRLKAGSNINLSIGKFNRTHDGSIMAACFSFVVPRGHIGVLTINPRPDNQVDPDVYVGYSDHGKVKYLAANNKGNDILILPLFFSQGTTPYSGVLFNAASVPGQAEFHFHTVDVMSAALAGTLEGIAQAGVIEYLSDFFGFNGNKNTTFINDVSRALTIGFSTLNNDSFNQTSMKIALNEISNELTNKGLGIREVQIITSVIGTILQRIYKHY